MRAKKNEGQKSRKQRKFARSPKVDTGMSEQSKNCRAVPKGPETTELVISRKSPEESKHIQTAEQTKNLEKLEPRRFAEWGIIHAVHACFWLKVHVRFQSFA